VRRRALMEEEETRLAVSVEERQGMNTNCPVQDVTEVECDPCWRDRHIEKQRNVKQKFSRVGDKSLASQVIIVTLMEKDLCTTPRIMMGKVLETGVTNALESAIVRTGPQLRSGRTVRDLPLTGQSELALNWKTLARLPKSGSWKSSFTVGEKLQ
jgi:hypothetical protein